MKTINQPLNFAVSMKHICKDYVIRHEKPTFIESLISGRPEKFRALDNINLNIPQGQRLGIIGPNGSGKTTILKIISGITSPSSGQIFVNGKIISLIDLEAGFHPDLTGVQNVFLNGMLLGMSKNEINNKFRKIVTYAGIGKFIDVPLFTFSSGMKLRLSFAVAIHADPDILILDESMSVGDENFRLKAEKSIKELFKKHKTVIMVSHWHNFIFSNCERIIEFDKGKIISDRKNIIEPVVK